MKVRYSRLAVALMVCVAAGFAVRGCHPSRRNDAVAPLIKLMRAYDESQTAIRISREAYPDPRPGAVPKNLQRRTASAAHDLDTAAVAFRRLAESDQGSRRQILATFSQILEIDSARSRTRAKTVGTDGVRLVWCDPTLEDIQSTEDRTANRLIDAYDLDAALRRPRAVPDSETTYLTDCAIALRATLEAWSRMQSGYRATRLLAVLATKAPPFLARVRGMTEPKAEAARALQVALLPYARSFAALMRATATSPRLDPRLLDDYARAGDRLFGLLRH